VFDSDQDVDLAAELESAEAFERQGDDKTHGTGRNEKQTKHTDIQYNENADTPQVHSILGAGSMVCVLFIM